MQFWLKSAVVLAMTGVIAGCSSSDEQVVNEDHKYVHAPEQQPITLPPGSIPLEGEDTYVLPELEKPGQLGEKLDIQAPPLPLALASGSRLDDQQRNKIWFDRTTVVDDLPVFAFTALRSFLDKLNVSGSTFNPAAKTAQTGWLAENIEGGWWPWSEDSRTTAYKFDYTQTQRAKGLVASVQIDLAGYQTDGQEQPLSSLTPEQRQRIEVEFLNNYVYHFQLAQEKLMKKEEIARSYELTLKVGQDKNGNVAFHSDKSVEVVWVQFRALIEDLNFKVDDVDRSRRKFFVSYGMEEKGFWDSLWSSESQVELPLPKGHYVLRITTDKTQSAIRLFDANEQPVDADVYQSLIAPLVDRAKALALEL